MERNPFTGPYVDGWRLVCPPVRVDIQFLRELLLPTVIFGTVLVAYILFPMDAMETTVAYYVVLPLFLLSLLAAYTYYAYATRPAKVLELTPDSVMLFEKGRGRRPVVEIPYTRDVEVDVFLNQHVGWDEHGMLYGWTFRKGDDLIRLHPDDNWDLWRLQELSVPILWLVERYNLRKGKDLADYLDQLDSTVDGGQEPWLASGIQ